MTELTPDTVEVVLEYLVKAGGPAFPSKMTTLGAEFHGLTMRDYFAAQAMQATLGSDTAVAEIMASDMDADRHGLAAGVARAAYLFADAMLKERSK